MAEVLRLAAGDVRAVVLPEDGGRLGSVVVAGQELLVTQGMGPMQWGSYPMVPWAGRIRRGRFRFDGREHVLPQGMPPHAIHGVAYDRPWRIDGPAQISIELDDRWPFGGRARQRFVLDEEGLEVVMTVEADEEMPVTIGWHPWFRRRLAGSDEPAVLRFSARSMLLRDGDGMPDGRLVPPTPGPWDDVFTGVGDGPELEWPGRIRLALSSTCAWWVVYSEPEHAICVEPQSGPPDAVNLGSVRPDLAPSIVRPGVPLEHSMRWRWTRL